MAIFLSPSASVSVESFPYRHVVIENAFGDELAERLHRFHQRSASKLRHLGKLEKVAERFYSARNYTPDLVDFFSGPLSIFCSDGLQSFICGLLGVESNKCIMLNCHRHEPPSNNGYPHTDCAIVSFPKVGPRCNGFSVYQPGSGCTYADDTRDRQPDSRKVARSVACLYYIGNKAWRPGDGGETAMYASDKETVLKRIPPLHNSLLAFDTSPVSYHGYLAAPSKVRDSLIWWYHDDINRVMRRHKEKFERKRSSGMDPWDRWTDASQEKYQPPDDGVPE